MTRLRDNAAELRRRVASRRFGVSRISAPSDPNHWTVMPRSGWYSCGDCRHLVGENRGDRRCAAHGRVCTACAPRHARCVARRRVA